MGGLRIAEVAAGARMGEVRLCGEAGICKVTSGEASRVERMRREAGRGEASRESVRETCGETRRGEVRRRGAGRGVQEMQAKRRAEMQTKMQAEERSLGETLAAEEHGHRNTELGQVARKRKTNDSFYKYARTITYG